MRLQRWRVPLLLLPLVWLALLWWPLQGGWRLPACHGRYDAVVVLFSGWDGARLDDEAQRRVAEAVAAWREDPAMQLLCVGGLRAARTVTGAAQMCAAAQEQGVPASAVLLGPGSYSSAGNLAEVRAVAHQQRWRRVLLVSSAAHLGRLHDWGLNTLQGVEIGFKPHDERDESLFERLRALHYEAAVRVAHLVFGPAVMDRLARWLRPQVRPAASP